MKLGGLGPVNAINAVNRFDKVKSGVADKTSTKPTDTPEVARTSGSSISSPVRSAKATSSNKSKDFSDILEDEGKDFEKVETKSDVQSEATLAGASGVQPKQPETPAGSSVKINPDVKTDKSADIKAVDKATITSTALEPTSVEEKINAIAESLEETADTELSMRHLSMRDFLGKMKDEFGIEPKAIVNAFAKLDEKQLTTSPEKSADAVLAQLNLKPEQMPKAERFYQEMLNETGDSALHETLVGVGAGMSLKVMSEQDIAMEKLQNSITNLNDAFARRNENPELSNNASVLGAMGVGAMVAAQAPAMAGSMAATVSPLQMAIDDSQGEFNDSVLTPEEDVETAGIKDKSGESKFVSLGAALSSATAGLAASFNETGGKEGKSNSKDSASSESKPRAFDSIESALAAGPTLDQLNAANMGSERAATPLAAGTTTSAALAATLANQNGDGTTTNAQDLVRHAQMLVKAGGGEMKMQLKPEGVGDVTLKVAVKDGQVQIQMMTESDSAKKLLESNLDDLKTSLAQNKLHIDAVKIEVGGDMAKQRFEQGQQDANREQTRQMAQDFMGQFRQDRQDFRGGFQDFSGLKNYQQPRKNPAPEIEPVAASTVSKKENSSGDRRLNLVA